MSKKYILWADDDTDDLMLMRHVLQDIEQTYDIREVNNGREALDYLEAAKEQAILPALIILDMNMPVMNGKETLTFLKKDEALKDVPVVFFTTSNSEMDKMYCRRLGVEMITKPPQYNRLKETVCKLLENYIKKSE
ncbi:MAG: response regulator [Chitinophagaceae bacterium]|nr:MAG: response regulator [Chitinophagaceae bacterium]RYZ45531.1 MAG: response regulator [Chitinophagaceae bacterium]